MTTLTVPEILKITEAYIIRLPVKYCMSYNGTLANMRVTITSYYPNGVVLNKYHFQLIKSHERPVVQIQTTYQITPIICDHIFDVHRLINIIVDQIPIPRRDLRLNILATGFVSTLIQGLKLNHVDTTLSQTFPLLPGSAICTLDITSIDRTVHYDVEIFQRNNETHNPSLIFRQFYNKSGEKLYVSNKPDMIIISQGLMKDNEYQRLERPYMKYLIDIITDRVHRS